MHSHRALNHSLGAPGIVVRPFGFAGVDRIGIKHHEVGGISRNAVSARRSKGRRTPERTSAVREAASPT